MTGTAASLTPEEYLAFERQAEFQHEYVAGRIIPRDGARRSHGLIVTGLASEIHARVPDPCEVYLCQMRVKIPPRDYVYPDVVVTCDPRFEDDASDTLTSPVVVIEVLSETTEAFDRGAKFALYRRIETLREYVLLSQNQALLEHYVRAETGWTYRAIDDLDCSLALVSLGIEIPLRRIYEDVLELLAPAEGDAAS